MAYKVHAINAQHQLTWYPWIVIGDAESNVRYLSFDLNHIIEDEVGEDCQSVLSHFWGTVS